MLEPDANLLGNYLVLGGLLFGIGMLGFMARRNFIVMFLSAEMMLQGVSLTLVALSYYHRNWQGQIFTIFILTVAAAEAAIALALILMLFRRRGSLDVSVWQGLREPEMPPVVDQTVVEAEPEETLREYPHLTPAGVAPDDNRERQTTPAGQEAPAPGGGLEED